MESERTAVIEQIAKLTALVMGVFPDAIRLEVFPVAWVVKDEVRPYEQALSARLPGHYTIMLSVMATWTRAHLISPDEAPEIPDEVAKDAFLRNDTWTDFVGWVSNTRQRYDEAGPHFLITDETLTPNDHKKAAKAYDHVMEARIAPILVNRFKGGIPTQEIRITKAAETAASKYFGHIRHLGVGEGTPDTATDFANEDF